MTRQTTYDAVTNWMSPPSVVGLNNVSSGFPVILDGAAFRLFENGGWGAYGFTHLQESRELIMAMGGIRKIMYTCHFMMLFQQVIEPNFDMAADPAFYQKNLNTLLDSATGRLRENHTLGTTPNANGVGGVVIPNRQGVLFQAAVGDLESESVDLVINSDPPVWDSQGGKVWSWHTISFQIVEMAQL